MAQAAMTSTSSEGKDTINRECHQLQFEMDQIHALLKQQQKSLRNYLDVWNDFEKAVENTKLLIASCEVKLKSEPKLENIEKAKPEDLERAKVSES